MSRQEEINDIIAKLSKPRSAVPSFAHVRESKLADGNKKKDRQPAKPKWVLLAASVPLILAGLAWSFYEASLPLPPPPRALPVANIPEEEPPAAPQPSGNATTSVVKQKLSDDPVYDDPVKQAQQVLFDEKVEYGSPAEHRFLRPQEDTFKGPAAYAVVFYYPIDNINSRRWAEAGIELVDNYGPLISVYYVPDARAYAALADVPVQICRMCEPQTAEPATVPNTL
jgi:hypothetical protein